MHRKFTVAIAAILTCLFVGGDCFAQSFPKEKQAELAFEIRMDKLRGTPLYDVLASNIEQMQAEVAGDMDIEKINRVWGAIQLPESPEDMEAMEGLQPGSELPVEMVFQIEFADSETADMAMEKIQEEAEEVSIEGKSFFKPSQDEAPANMLAHRLNSTTIEAGTEGYLASGDAKSALSSGLGEAWGSFDDEPIRVAFDIDNARTLVTKGLEMAKEDAPPFFHPVIDSLASANNVCIAIDLKDGGNLLKLSMLGADEEGAEKLRSGLDGLLGFAKMAGGGAVEQLRNQDEGMADVVSAILKSLNATRDGNNVEITIPKPDGFEDAIQGMMQMGGMGGNDF